MNYGYRQSTGVFFVDDPQDGRKTLGIGYSGQGSGYNNPDAEHIVRVGPIPRGVWRVGTAINHPRLGRFAIPLYSEGRAPHGRGGFYVHGDNRRGNGTASSGCIILSRIIRERLKPGDRITVER